VAPLSHAAGMHAFSMLTLGATLIIMPEFEPDDILRYVQEYSVTHIWLPATALYLLLNHSRVGSCDLSSLRSIVLGASAVAPSKLKEAVAVFGPCVSVNYSQIESGFLTWLDAKTLAAAAAGTHPERLASSGRSTFAGRLAIMDERGRIVEPFGVGEIVVRGRSVKPYIRGMNAMDEAELERSTAFAWHHTADLGYLDDEGFLYVVGRTKDIVISAGFKISAAEVERVVLEVPEVAECALIAIPDDFRGEVGMGIVVPREGAVVRPKSIIAHCRRRLGAQHAPASVEIWPGLPKTVVGKLDKRRIREIVLARRVGGESSTWSG
jgi:fatty-acyl-CoA synthase